MTVFLRKMMKFDLLDILKKDPHCEAIHGDTHQKQDCIKQRKNDLTDFVIAGAVAVVSRVAEVGCGFHLHFVFSPLFP